MDSELPGDSQIVPSSVWHLDDLDDEVHMKYGLGLTLLGCCLLSAHRRVPRLTHTSVFFICQVGMAEGDGMALTIPFMTDRLWSPGVVRSHRACTHGPCTHCCLSCPQGSLVTSVQEMQTVCIVVSGICFFIF